MIVEHHRHAGIRAQALAAGAGSQINASRSTGVVAMLLMQSRQSFTPCWTQISLSAARSFRTLVEVSQCVHQIHVGAFMRQTFAHEFKIEWACPIGFNMLKAQLEPLGLIGEALTELAIAQHEARSGQQGKLRSHDVVGKRADPATIRRWWRWSDRRAASWSAAHPV